MMIFGPLSSVFDLVTFGVLLWAGASQVTFHSLWFVESVLSGGLAMLVLRTPPAVAAQPAQPGFGCGHRAGGSGGAALRTARRRPRWASRGRRPSICSSSPPSWWPTCWSSKGPSACSIAMSQGGAAQPRGPDLTRLWRGARTRPAAAVRAPVRRGPRPCRPAALKPGGRAA
jgi:hypothetical protein